MIQIKIDARAHGQKGASFNVILTMDDYKWVRGMQCGKITTNQTALKGIEYALKSINTNFDNESIEIKTSGRYAIMMLSKKDGKWAKNSRKNSFILDVVRQQYDRFNDIKIVYDKLEDMHETTLNVARGEAIFSIKGQ